MADEKEIDDVVAEMGSIISGAEDKTDDDTSDVVDDMPDTEDSVDDADDSDDSGGDDSPEIDPVYVATAKSIGWDDEKIARIAKSDPDILQALHTLHSTDEDDEDEDPALDFIPKTEPKLVPKFEYTDEQKEKLVEKYGEDVLKDIVDPLSGAINSVVDRFNTIEEGQHQASISAEKKAIERLDSSCTKAFDKLADEYPELGKWDKMPRGLDGKIDLNHPAVVARLDMFSRAIQAKKAFNLSDEEAIQDAVFWYRGKNQSTKVEQKIIKNLQNQKKSFVSRPGHKKVQKKDDRPSSEIAIDAMDEVFKKHSLK